IHGITLHMGTIANIEGLLRDRKLATTQAGLYEEYTAWREEFCALPLARTHRRVEHVEALTRLAGRYADTVCERAGSGVQPVAALATKETVEQLRTIQALVIGQLPAWYAGGEDCFERDVAENTGSAFIRTRGLLAEAAAKTYVAELMLGTGAQ